VGERSIVRSGGSRRTLMHCPAFWDEDGIYHHHDENVNTVSYTCSRGHSWIEKTKNPCPAPNCEWKGR
jgi:hypothetical protein